MTHDYYHIELGMRRRIAQTEFAEQIRLMAAEQKRYDDAKVAYAKAYAKYHKLDHAYAEKTKLTIVKPKGVKQTKPRMVRNRDKGKNKVSPRLIKLLKNLPKDKFEKLMCNYV